MFLNGDMINIRHFSVFYGTIALISSDRTTLKVAVMFLYICLLLRFNFGPFFQIFLKTLGLMVDSMRVYRPGASAAMEQQTIPLPLPCFSWDEVNFGRMLHLDTRKTS